MKSTATIAEMSAAMDKQKVVRTYEVIRPLKPKVERTNYTNIYIIDFIACVRVEYGIVMACCVDE